MGLSGCRTKAPREEGIPLVSREEVQKLLSKNDVLIVDNRPAANYAEGHIPGAVNLPFLKPDDPENVMDAERLQQAAEGKRIIIFYCFGRIRGPNAMKAARDWGIPAELFLYKDGFPDWVRQGGSVER